MSTSPAGFRHPLQPSGCRSEPSSFFKISVTGSKADIKVKGSKCTAVLAQQQQQHAAAASAASDSSVKRSGSSSTRRYAKPRHAAAVARGLPALSSSAGAGFTGAALSMYDPPVAAEVPVQRLFEFAAEVWVAPAEGPFRATKVVSIKSKWILFNDTGMVLEYKQRGTPDATHPGYASYGDGRRFAGLLQPQERVAFHWDNIFEPRQLVIRPAAPGWPWSGAFHLPDREAYFGLRLRNR